FFQVFPFLCKYAYETLMIKLGLSPGEKYVWGVRYKGYQKDLTKDYVEFCITQWLACTQSMIKNKHLIKNENILIMRYENIVSNPKKEFSRIADFLKVNSTNFDFSTIKPSNVGKSKNKLPKEIYNKIETELKPMLKELGYVK